MTDPLDLEPIKAKLAAATPGPWHARGDGEDPDGPPRAVAMPSHWPMVGKDGFREYICEHQTSSYDDQARANARFIADSPTDLAALIAEVERLREILDLECDYNAGPYPTSTQPE